MLVSLPGSNHPFRGPSIQSACLFVVRQRADVHTSAPLPKSIAGIDDAVCSAGGSRPQWVLAVRNVEGRSGQAPWWRPGIMALLDAPCALADARLSCTTLQKLVFNRKCRTRPPACTAKSRRHWPTSLTTTSRSWSIRLSTAPRSSVPLLT
jgi:hypothetical protein